MYVYIGGWGERVRASQHPPKPGNRFVSFVRACVLSYVMSFRNEKVNRRGLYLLSFGSGGVIFYLGRSLSIISAKKSSEKEKVKEREREREKREGEREERIGERGKRYREEEREREKERKREREK